MLVLACRSWPTIGELRSKIMFVADPGYIDDYNTAFPNLTNAVMFTSDVAHGTGCFLLLSSWFTTFSPLTTALPC